MGEKRLLAKIVERAVPSRIFASWSLYILYKLQFIDYCSFHGEIQQTGAANPGSTSPRSQSQQTQAPADPSATWTRDHPAQTNQNNCKQHP